jgi:hypothetical protein
MLGFEAFMLPSSASLLSLPATSALPVAVFRPDGQKLASAASIAAIAAGGASPPQMNRLGGPPNISVIMPCYGQSRFLEEGLRSVLEQQYPAAEIIVVDDGSEDNCGRVAKEKLDGPLAPLRRANVRKLRAWWGWGDDELRRFKDEVVLTPNRGVAHARNTGIRRARGDWIMCLDADDMVEPTYFSVAMEHVAQAPSTNLVYANQQFFEESRWQWHVPELRADTALVNGPLPLMTLFRKSLWEATPHGFDEALPKGHEDWARGVRSEPTSAAAAAAAVDVAAMAAASVD